MVWASSTSTSEPHFLGWRRDEFVVVSPDSVQIGRQFLAAG